MGKFTPYLQRRGDRFYFRMFVPPKLRPVLGCREVTRALCTGERRRAEISALRLAAITKEFFDKVRNLNEPDDQPEDPAFVDDVDRERASLNERLKALLNEGVALSEREERIKRSLKLIMDRAEERRAQMHALAPSEVAAKAPTILAELHRLDRLADRMIQPVLEHGDRQRQLDAQYAELTHEVEKLSLSELHSNVVRTRQQKFDAALQQAAEFSAIQIKAAGGIASVAAAVKPRRTSHRLSEALPIWKRLKSPAPSTFEIYAAAVRRFEAKHPNLRVSDIERKHVRDYIQWLQEKQLSAKTIEKEHGALRALLSIGVHEEWIDSNPAAGAVLPAARATKKVRGYTLDEVQRILESPVFKHGTRPKSGKGEAAYWVPLLLLFTGARREEICQLTVKNVATKGGIAYVSINPRDDEGRVKTDESRRIVPLHDRLIQRGFLHFVEQVRKQGGEFLFDRLKLNKRDQRGAKWGDWWGKYVRTTVGISAADVHPAHSFRHLFITLCRATNMREDYEWAITGHSRRGERR